MIGLTKTTEICKMLGDKTRIRLLGLLHQRELTVAELTHATLLPQSRVSTHLRKLLEGGFVTVSRSGNASYYRLVQWPDSDATKQLWELMSASLNDAVMTEDAARAESLVNARRGASTWAEKVAGNMARHYSPGRTWEALTRGLLGLLRLGRVIDVASGDGGVAEMLAPRAESITCVEKSEAVMKAAAQRLGPLRNVKVVKGDMHALGFESERFDQAILMSALEYSEEPRKVLQETARVLRPGGLLVGTVLRKHTHGQEVISYDHLNHGFEPDELSLLLESVGYDVALCGLTSRERKMPHFEIITFHATKRERTP